MNRAEITGGYWQDRLTVNALTAVFHQWEQLESSGCIENFRVAAGESKAFREGWFFADSDAYKWLEAAVRALALREDKALRQIAEGFIALLGRVQQQDGYIYTYNQIHFPHQRWENLKIEHELYCHGHLIEAGVSDYELNGETGLFRLARRAADRVTEDFLARGPEKTPGHQEIELALIRIYRVSGEARYLQAARRFMEDRGRGRGFGLQVIQEFARVGRRGKDVRHRKEAYMRERPDYRPVRLPPENHAEKPAGSAIRLYAEALTGRYFQQHRPLRRLTEPSGHAVRFLYQQTAAAMLARETGDEGLTALLGRAWDRMVEGHLYVTGGLGSVPGTEGFGRPGVLPNETAYAETCAALGSIFWSREMAGLTGEARYADLIEWQLYNGSAVGISPDGRTYFYNNPLLSRGTLQRRLWYAVPCCPSNISRTWADLGRYVFGESREGITVNQYIHSRFQGEKGTIDMQSVLPWEGKAVLEVAPVNPGTGFTLWLRIPSWSSVTRVLVNGEDAEVPPPGAEKAAGGYDPRAAGCIDLRRAWQSGDRVELTFDMALRMRRATPTARDCRGRVALSRGPVVYCLEDTDNPGVDIFEVTLGRETPKVEFRQDLLGGTDILRGVSADGKTLTFIPWFLWGNRGPSKMSVWIRYNKEKP